MSAAVRFTEEDLRLLPPALTVEEAAGALGISRSSAYNAVRAGTLGAVRISNRFIVPKNVVLELLRMDAERPSLPGLPQTPTPDPTISLPSERSEHEFTRPRV